MSRFYGSLCINPHHLCSRLRFSPGGIEGGNGLGSMHSAGHNIWHTESKSPTIHYSPSLTHVNIALLPDKKFNSTEQIYLLFSQGSVLSLIAPPWICPYLNYILWVTLIVVPFQRSTNIIVWRLVTICGSYFTVYTNTCSVRLARCRASYSVLHEVVTVTIHSLVVTSGTTGVRLTLPPTYRHPPIKTSVPIISPMVHLMLAFSRYPPS